MAEYPFPLHTLAKHMRKGTWLDIRTDECLLQRVRIVEMVVRVQGEDLVLRQEWMDGDHWCKQQFPVDSDAVFKVLLTNYDIEQVQPYGVLTDPPPGTTGVSAERADQVVTRAIECAMYVYDLTRERVMESTDWNDCDKRHQTMLVIYEMTDLETVELCERFGYKSQTPLLTARDKTRPGHWNQRGAEYTAGVKRLGALVIAQIGPSWRSKGFPRDYSPVIAR